jgi:hypothetical protein
LTIEQWNGANDFVFFARRGELASNRTEDHRWLALLVLAQNVAVQRGFLDPPAAADLNGRNLSALYEIVDSRGRNPQVLGRLFYRSRL